MPEHELFGRAAFPVHDTRIRTWRHLDFFHHQTFLTARIRRVSCHCSGVHQGVLPWAREGTGFPTLFQTLLWDLARQMP